MASFWYSKDYCRCSGGQNTIVSIVKDLVYNFFILKGDILKVIKLIMTTSLPFSRTPREPILYPSIREEFV